ncbi:hypothetical protein CHCC20335_2339 [Bacillus paralicheniformis]|nr:hypothetical protein CHCC20335_2339 [Bacillus paralicheniformis]
MLTFVSLKKTAKLCFLAVFLFFMTEHRRGSSVLIRLQTESASCIV